MSSDKVVIYVTIGSEADADTLTRTLLAERRVACINRIGPIQSSYHWEGTIMQDQEFLLVLKTCAKHLPTLIPRIKELHPYAVPEIIALPIVAGYEPYLNWIADETREYLQ